MFQDTIKSAVRQLPLWTLLMFIIAACGSQLEERQNSPEAGKYIAAHTSGVISSHDEIIVRFVNQHPQAGNFYEAIDKQLFELDPSIKGQAYWIDDYTLAFKPDEQLDQSTKYQVVLKMSSLFEVDKSLEEFFFTIQTRVLDFRVDIAALTPYPGQTDYYKLIGDLDFSDRTGEDIPGKILKATQDGKELPIQWRRLKNGLLCEFEIDSIIRKDEEGLVMISWDGRPVGIETRGEQEIQVPSKDEFQLLKVRVYQLPSQRVELSFSDQLRSDQMLDGLLKLEGDDDLTLSIKGNKLDIYPDGILQGMIEISIMPGIESATGIKIEKQIKEKNNPSVLPFGRITLQKATGSQSNFVEKGKVKATRSALGLSSIFP